MSAKMTRREIILSATALGVASTSCNLVEKHSSREADESYVASTISVPAIDVHGHYGPYYRKEGNQLRNEFMTADAEEVVTRARRANIRWTIVSPLLGLVPRGDNDPVAGNIDAARIVPETDGLLQWVVVDPLKPKTYEQATEMLKTPDCVGIKIHPDEHVYPIKEHGRALFEFASQHARVVLTHSGGTRSLPEDYVELANTHPELTIILAHLGNGEEDGDPSHQVRAIQASKHGNLYADTSSAQSINAGLIEWAVKEAGADHLVLGTDTPLYFAPMQRARIDHASICDDDKRKILWGNSAKIFKLDGRPTSKSKT